MMPKVRFPEYVKPWNIEKVGAIFKVSAGGDIAKGKVRSEVTGVYKYPVYANSEKKSGLYGYTDEFKYQGATVTVAGRGVNIGLAIARNEKFYPIVRLLVLVPKSENVDNKFFELCLNRLKIFIESTGVPQLTAPQLSGYKLAFPEIDEQQKIAEFLSSVDKKISLLKEKYALLEQYKKCVMQKLFKQEIRFKDDGGSEFPDWQEMPLSELSLKVSSKNKDESVTQVLTNSAKDGIMNQGDYFNKDIANQGNLGGYTIVEKDDFVYNPRISELAPVGPIKRNHKGQGVMSPLYTVFKFKDKSLLDFVEQYFNTSMWHRYMHSIANFGARHDRMNITTSDFYALPVPIPCQKEREKIVAFIEALNSKCDAVKSQLELTQTFKKGLLQQMFV